VWTHSFTVVEDFIQWGFNTNRITSIAWFNPGQQTNSCTNSRGGDTVAYDWNADGARDHAAIRKLDHHTTDPNSGISGHVINQNTSDRYHAIWHLKPYNSKRETTWIYVYRPQ